MMMRMIIIIEQNNTTYIQKLGIYNKIIYKHKNIKRIVI